MLTDPGYIFGPGTGVPTYEELKRRRAQAVAQAMQKQRAAPKNIGEGIFSVGESVGDVINERRLNDAERQLEAKQAADVARIQAGAAGGTAAPPYPGLGAGAGLPGATAEATPIPDYRARIAAVMTPGGGGAPPENPTGAAPTTAMSAPLVGSDDPADEARWNARARAIGGIESGGRSDPYAALGATTPRGDRAYGRYQVMGANIPQWSKAALGAALTPEQFLASKEAQDDVFRHRFGGYVDKYGDEGAARAWYGGEKGMRNLGATDQHGRMTVGNYGQQYMNALGGPRGAPTAALTTGTVSDAPTPGVPRVPGIEENPTTESSIRPAPAADPIRVAGPATAAGPAKAPIPADYDWPEPKRTVPPRPMPMDPKEIALRRSLPMMHPETPQFRATQQIISEYDQRRAHHDAREIERAKSEDAAYNILYPKYLEHQAGRRKRELDAREAEQKLLEGNRIKLGQKERLITMDKDGNYKDMTPSRPNVGDGRPDVELTGEQSKTFDNLQKADVAMEHYRRIPDADKVLAEGLRDELAGRVPFFNNALLSSRYRRARNAALNVASAHLREISGAAIGVAEEAKTIAQMFPVYGDDPTMTKQKRKIVDSVLSGMSLKLGSAAEPLITYARKERGREDAVEQQKMRDEMAGVGVPEVGKIYTNKDKNGKVISRRFWTGSRWEDD